MHQTVIGEEAQMQMDETEDYPDVLIGCTGGGSNFSGLTFPFIGRALREEAKIRVIAVEPAACPSLTKGLYAFDFGDTGHLTPLVKMHTLGSTFVPPPFHAGGLRYHGMAPMVSHLKELGLIEARAYTQSEVFAAGVEFARVEGILPAPEANHAVKAAIDEAVRCREEGVSQAILFNLCGHGHFDMLLEGPRTIAGLLGLLPESVRPRYERVGRDIYRTISGYVTGNLLISLVAGLLATVVLFAVGSEFAVALGLLVAILDLIPLAGATLAAIIVSTVVLIETDWIRCLIVIAFFIAYQQFENSVLQVVIMMAPLVGRSMAPHPFQIGRASCRERV